LRRRWWQAARIAFVRLLQGAGSRLTEIKPKAFALQRSCWTFKVTVEISEKMFVERKQAYWCQQIGQEWAQLSFPPAQPQPQKIGPSHRLAKEHARETPKQRQYVQLAASASLSIEKMVWWCNGGEAIISWSQVSNSCCSPYRHRCIAPAQDRMWGCVIVYWNWLLWGSPMHGQWNGCRHVPEMQG